MVIGIVLCCVTLSGSAQEASGRTAIANEGGNLVDVPAAGYVPDSVTAIQIAEAVMGGLYGQKKAHSL